MSYTQVEAEKFDATLAELKSKAELLSTKLDEEAANKKQTEAEVTDFSLANNLLQNYFKAFCGKISIGEDKQ